MDYLSEMRRGCGLPPLPTAKDQSKTLRLDNIAKQFAPFPNGLILTNTPAPAADIPPTPVRFEHGVPVYRFRKELIHCGKFDLSDGTTLNVDRRQLQQWSATFSNMRSSGVAVPVPVAHDRVDGDGNRGFIVDMFPEGEKLIGIVELKGEDAPRIAASNDVSLAAEPEFTDSRGNHYVYPIRHVALTPYPKIQGMGKFQAISAGATPRKAVSAVRLSQDQRSIPLGVQDDMRKAAGLKGSVPPQGIASDMRKAAGLPADDPRLPGDESGLFRTALNAHEFPAVFARWSLAKGLSEQAARDAMGNIVSQLVGNLVSTLKSEFNGKEPSL